METDSLASGKHFLLFFLDSNQLLLVKAIFPSIGSYFLANVSFPLVETFFLFGGKSIFKEEPYSCCGNLFSNTFIQLVQTDFLLTGKSICLVRTILLLVETIIRIRSKQFSKKELVLAKRQLETGIFWWLDTIFFYFHFSETPASNFSV